MLVEERRQKILDLVSEKGFVALTDLAEVLEASESTIRRDLDYWGQQGVLKRTHGGAVFLAESFNNLPALEERTSEQMEEKRAIAQAAASRIQDGDAVLLDGGTTTLEVAACWSAGRCRSSPTVCRSPTCSPASRETDLVMLGGYIYPRTGVALGPLTVRMMEDMHVQPDDPERRRLTAKGLFNSNLLLVETERQMMRCADEVVVVADHTKIGRQALAFLCELSAIDTLIVDSGLSPEQRELLEQAGVRLIVAGEDGQRGVSADDCTLDRAAGRTAGARRP